MRDTPAPTRHGPPAEPSAERAYRELKEAVQVFALTPGSRVTESALAERFGFSKPVVHQALGRLAREGFVEPLPRSGYRVAPLTLKEAGDLFGVLSHLEGEAARLAAERPADDRRELLRLARRHDEPASVDDALRGDGEFLVALVALAGNMWLGEVLHATLDRLQRYIRLAAQRLPQPADIVPDRSGLLDALASGDPAAATERARDRVVAFEGAVLDTLLRTAAVQSFNLADGRPTAPVVVERPFLATPQGGTAAAKGGPPPPSPGRP